MIPELHMCKFNRHNERTENSLSYHAQNVLLGNLNHEKKENIQLLPDVTSLNTDAPAAVVRPQ